MNVNIDKDIELFFTKQLILSEKSNKKFTAGDSLANKILYVTRR